jgi:D-alanyl-D-alanine carboxypeptidase
MRRSLFVVLTATLSVIQLADAAPRCTATLTSELQHLLTEQSLPAAQFSLRGRNVQAIDLAFGEASPGRPLAVEQPLRIASLSKILTGLAVLDADADKSLPLGSKLVDVLGIDSDSSGRGVGDITLRDLLGHRSGLRRHAGLDEMLRPEPRCPPHIGQLLSEPLHAPAGATFQYSNTGYCLLGEALRVRTGQSLADRVAASIVRRIGRSAIAPYDESDLTVRYHASPDDPTDDSASYHFNYPAMLASGGFQSNARDLSRLLARAFPSDRLKTLDTSTAACARRGGPRNCHGLIFHVFDDARGQRMFWRDGSLPGVSALAVVPAHARWNWVFIATRRHRDGLRLNEQLLASIDHVVARHLQCEETERQTRPGMKR